MSEAQNKTPEGGGDEIGRTAGGFVIAALLPAFILGVIVPFDNWSLRRFTMVFLIILPFSAAATLAVGLPAFLILRPFRPGHWWSVSLAGFGLGVLVAIAMRLPGPPDPHDFLIIGPLAMLSTLAFWRIWKTALPQTK
tara:strand:- start:2337 stop:2750 length:414 start_codon:yes stop_codon:yes gene_type:complete